ncbi:MAG: iron-sulfur cluster repair di-iron protein [Saprospiraceae bacterium]|nr:iron-sulfur cluster repair di-iron protein [Saprospiraceae bacterium]MCF8248973.1 iron-sulfur cluster repair di-iron protein [Saprospiraceae bacterium]MCF8279184.1 iron-sulfur cluster repair di-iron protein [Bacteroidales bacterium]MCF8310867.1 iron-sulfur cluster repair di-iron protein [Saprospiraceae bacterium]MCF8439545.1 iron-sulfur cluster repair di-iron protein [Saprospiraceae bacterium]
MNFKENLTIGEIVAQDYRTASVFQSHGIDFCCKGGRTIGEVCESKNLAAPELVQELQSATASSEAPAEDYRTWPLDLLADYVEKKHHRYVAAKMPELMQYLNKLCKVHGERHPELFEIRDEFSHVNEELTAHMQKEEMILFPFIRRLATEKQPTRPPFGTVENPINMMMHEHTVEGERLAKISELSSKYTSPADGCTTYRVAFAMLKEFEEDLHLHIHLENNIMFPRAIELEKQLVQFEVSAN